MTKLISKAPISQRELLVYRAELRGAIFRQLHHRLEAIRGEPHKFTQKDLAVRIHADPAVVSRRLAGENDMQLETLCDMARGLECRIEVQLTPLGVIEEENQFPAFKFYDLEGGRWEPKRFESEKVEVKRIEPPVNPNPEDDKPTPFDPEQPPVRTEMSHARS